MYWARKTALQHTATHCNTFQHTLTHCGNIIPCMGALQGDTEEQHTAAHCGTLQHTATQCNTLQHNATQCNTLQLNVSHSASHWNKVRVVHSNTHCNTLQHTLHNTLNPEKSIQLCIERHKRPMYVKRDIQKRPINVGNDLFM